MKQIGGNKVNPDRHPTDLYPTDSRWTEALLDRVLLRGSVWECAAGNGDMVKVLSRYGYSGRETDLITGTDFLTCTEPWLGSIVTNPPYRHADAFVAKALKLASEQVAMLLPIGTLGSERRNVSLWQPHPPAMVIIVTARMLVHGKRSQFNHVWAVWDSRHTGTTELIWA